jgi:hypothetical protein
MDCHSSSTLSALHLVSACKRDLDSAYSSNSSKENVVVPTNSALRREAYILIISQILIETG